VAITVLVLVLGLVAPRIALAQFVVEANATVSSGYTNLPNPGTVAQVDPNDPNHIIAPTGADAFFEISPGVILLYNNGRVRHALSYNFFATLYAQETGATSYTNRLAWTMLTDLSPRVRFAVGLTGAQGRQGTFQMQRMAAALMAQPAGEVLFANAGGSETLTWALSPQWDLSQDLRVDTFIPLDPDQLAEQTLAADANLRVLRRWRRLGLGGRFGVAYLRRFGLDAQLDAAGQPVENTETPSAAQFLFSLLGEARYDLNDRWSVRAEGGGQMALPTAFDEFVMTGTGAGEVAYRHQRGRIALRAGHTLTPNVLLGEVFLAETLTLGGLLQLGPPRWRLRTEAMIGYGYQRAFELEAGSMRERLHTGLADVGVVWRFSPKWEITARYQLNMQEPAGEALAGAQVPGYTRHVGLLSLRFNYPAARNRRRTPRRGSTTRVDREQWDAVFDPTPGRQAGGQQQESSNR